MAQGQSDASLPAERFGGYVITRQLAAEAGAVIYRARKAEAPAAEESERYVVVVCRAPGAGSVAGDEGEGGASAVETDPWRQFLAGVELHKKAHEIDAAHFMPIHDGGISPAGAWYATDYYPRGFLKKWILQRAVVSEEELRHLVVSIVQGLLALQRHDKRSHGSLTVANVLIGGKMGAPLRKAPIVLTYLTPGEAGDAVRFELADLHAIGQIIYQLVCRRYLPTFSPDFHPVQATNDWSQLGKEGEGWLRLCNRLLDPELTLEETSLAKLAAELRRKPVMSPAALAAGLAALVLLGAGAVYYWTHSRGTSAAVDRATPPPEPMAASNGPGGQTNPGKLDPTVAPVETNAPAPPANRPPVISRIPDQTMESTQKVITVRFTVVDQETPASQLRVTCFSSNPSLIPEGNMRVGGSGPDRLLAVQRFSDVYGNCEVSVVVNDGWLDTTNAFTLTVKPAYAPPTLSDIGDQIVKLGTPSVQYPFKVGVNDPISGRVFVAVLSSRTSFLPNSSLKITGSGADRVLVIDPLPQQTGEVFLAMSVFDRRTNVSSTFTLKVIP